MLVSVCFECRWSAAWRLDSCLVFLPARHALKPSSPSVWNLRKWFRLLFTTESIGHYFNGEKRECMLYTRGPRFFQICRSQFQILGSLTWSKFHSKDLQFWSDPWNSLLPGAFCWMHVNPCRFLYGRGNCSTWAKNIWRHRTKSSCPGQWDFCSHALSRPKNGRVLSAISSV